MTRLGSILTKTLLTAAACLLLNVSMDSYAAKGDSKDNKKAKELNVTGFKAALQNININTNINSHYGWYYQGSSQHQKNNLKMSKSTIVTYRKGNTVYIYPVKFEKNKFQKFKSPEAPRF